LERGAMGEYDEGELRKRGFRFQWSVIRLFVRTDY